METARSRATSRTWTTSSPRTWLPARSRASRAASSTSPPAARRASGSSPTRSAASSGSRSRSATCRCARATCATRGPTSPRPGSGSDKKRRGRSRRAWAGRSRRSVGDIRVMRVIARLNMGGPALHVAYLSSGLAPRGYRTTLVAGSLARGEESMEFVAERHRVPVVHIPQLGRKISPLRDVVAARRLAALVRRERPHILHTHTAKAGAIGRMAALLAGDARPPIVVHTFHGHVLRGYFGPTRAGAFRLLERELAKVTTALVAVSPQVRDDLVALGVAPAEKFAVVRLGIELESRVGEL